MGARRSPPPSELHRARLPRDLHPRPTPLLRGCAALRGPCLTPRADRRERERRHPRERQDDPAPRERWSDLQQERNRHAARRCRRPDRPAVGRVRRPVLLRRRPARPRRGHATSLRRPQHALDRHRLGGIRHRLGDPPRSARGLLRRRDRLDHLASVRPDLGVPGHPARDRARHRARHQRLPPLGRSTSQTGSLWIPMGVIAFVFIPYIGRPLRGQVLALREKEFVEASTAQGAGPLRIMFSELLPNIASSVLVLLHADRRQRDPHRGRPVVPRRRRPASPALLGNDDRRRPADRRERPVAGHRCRGS